ncbi:MAG TPA: hypothetical protein VHE58_09345 [Burkholderiales bacterium]|nr:hypothetical protein [Burkholderiales bacterium]
MDENKSKALSFKGFAYLNVDHQVVAWGVYRGVLVSAQAAGTPPKCPVSVMFAGIVQSQNNARFQNELLIDAVRAQRYPQQMSRLAGMYFLEDLAQADKATAWGGHFRQENIVELEVHPVGIPARVDSNWITYAKVDGDGRLDQTDLSWVERYWSGQPFRNPPVWETIVHGRAVVFGTGLRKRAYDVIANAFPNALDMLEISRLAAAVGSDLGQTAAWVTQMNPTTFRLAYYLDMREANDPEFLKRLAAHDGPKNVRDLAPGKETFGVPDFRSYGCEFTVSRQLSSSGSAYIPAIHRTANGI